MKTLILIILTLFAGSCYSQQISIDQDGRITTSMSDFLPARLNNKVLFERVLRPSGDFIELSSLGKPNNVEKKFDERIGETTFKFFYDGLELHYSDLNATQEMLLSYLVIYNEDASIFFSESKGREQSFQLGTSTFITDIFPSFESRSRSEKLSPVSVVFPDHEGSHIRLFIGDNKRIERMEIWTDF